MAMISHIEEEILKLETQELATIKKIVDNELKRREEQKQKDGFDFEFYDDKSGF